MVLLSITFSLSYDSEVPPDEGTKVEVDAKKDTVQRIIHAAAIPDLEGRIPPGSDGKPCTEAVIAKVASSRSAGAQLEHPSEVNNSKSTGILPVAGGLPRPGWQGPA